MDPLFLYYKTNHSVIKLRNYYYLRNQKLVTFNRDNLNPGLRKQVVELYIKHATERLSKPLYFMQIANIEDISANTSLVTGQNIHLLEEIDMWNAWIWKKRTGDRQTVNSGTPVGEDLILGHLSNNYVRLNEMKQVTKFSDQISR